MNLKTSVILMSKCGLMFLHERLILLPLCPYPQNLREPSVDRFIASSSDHITWERQPCARHCAEPLPACRMPALCHESNPVYKEILTPGVRISSWLEPILPPKVLLPPKSQAAFKLTTFIFPSNLQLLFPCCKFSTLVPVSWNQHGYCTKTIYSGSSWCL